MRKFILSLFFTRASLIKIVFSDNEQTAIINSLWRRSEDLSTDNIQDAALRYTCKEIAKELG